MNEKIRENNEIVFLLLLLLKYLNLFLLTLLYFDCEGIILDCCPNFINYRWEKVSAYQIKLLRSLVISITVTRCQFKLIVLLFLSGKIISKSRKVQVKTGIFSRNKIPALVLCSGKVLNYYQLYFSITILVKHLMYFSLKQLMKSQNIL